MGPSSKGGRGKQRRELSDHELMLRRRLREALSLGIKEYDKGGRKWQCSDVEMQSHALRAMTSFIGSISPGLLQNPLMKDSVSDMLVALEGILQSGNERILSLAVDVIVKLVLSLGNSLSQYHSFEITSYLFHLLSSYQPPLAMSCAIALNCILTKLGPLKSESHAEIWKAIEKSNAVGSVACALQDYADSVQTPEYFTGLVSLLTTILWRWPPSRYHIWSNTNLLLKLVESCGDPNYACSIGILKLLSALALCGDGAMKLLETRELPAMMVQCMENSKPVEVRIHALILCQHLMRSPQGCSLVTSLYSEPMVHGIINAMSRWRFSSADKVSSDQMPLVMEALRTALITRWSGVHHSYFWNLGIDRVLLASLLGSFSTVHQIQATVSSNELMAAIYRNDSSEIKPYVWEILGWLAIHCEEDFLPETFGKLCYLDILISCACSITMDLMHKGRRYMAVHITELEPLFRALLLMVFSPCKYIASHTRRSLSEVVRTDDDHFLGFLLDSLGNNATANVSLVSGSLHTIINLIVLACHSTLPQCQTSLVGRGGIQILSALIRRCLDDDIRVTRSSIASHLHCISSERTCCWSHVEDWEGEDVLLFYSLQALSQLIWYSGLLCSHPKVTARDVVICRTCGNSEAQVLVNHLWHILCSNYSAGSKWYAAYSLTYFGFYGFPSNLGKRMEKALEEKEFADLQLILSNDHSLKVHFAILVARCPFLLPPEETSLKDRRLEHESTREQKIDHHGRTIRQEVRMSDRVDDYGLAKILEYVYTGFCRADYGRLKPLKILAKYCGLNMLLCMLHRHLPRWGTANPICDFTKALKPTGHSYSEIILEAETSDGETWSCTLCQFPKPHLHTHKIILWSSCGYLQALFHSGMQDSYSKVIKVPVGWKALVKLVRWLYAGELPKIKSCCIWSNMDMKDQLHELQAYVELLSLAEFWLLDEVGEESFNVVVSCLNSDQKISLEIITIAINLNQWKIVQVAVRNIAPLYPKMRDSGDLEILDEVVVEMLRSEYVRYSQEALVGKSQ